MKKIMSLLLAMIMLLACSANTSLQKDIDESLEIVNVDIPLSKDSLGISILDIDEDDVYYQDFYGGAFPSHDQGNTIYKMNIETSEVEELVSTDDFVGVLNAVHADEGLYYLTYESLDNPEHFTYTVHLLDENEDVILGSGRFSDLILTPQFQVHDDDIYLMVFDAFESKIITPTKEQSVALINLSEKEVKLELEDALRDFEMNEVMYSGSQGLLNARLNESIIFSTNNAVEDEYLSKVYAFNEGKLQTVDVSELFTFDFIEIGDAIVLNGRGQTNEVVTGTITPDGQYHEGLKDYHFTKIKDYKHQDTLGAIVRVEDMKNVEDNNSQYSYAFMYLREGSLVFEDIKLFDESFTSIMLPHGTIALDNEYSEDKVSFQMIKEK